MYTEDEIVGCVCVNVCVNDGCRLQVDVCTFTDCGKKPPACAACQHILGEFWLLYGSEGSLVWHVLFHSFCRRVSVWE